MQRSRHPRLSYYQHPDRLQAGWIRCRHCLWLTWLYLDRRPLPASPPRVRQHGRVAGKAKVGALPRLVDGVVAPPTSGAGVS
jgi:hypothetical protein